MSSPITSKSETPASQTEGSVDGEDPASPPSKTEVPNNEISNNGISNNGISNNEISNNEISNNEVAHSSEPAIPSSCEEEVISPALRRVKQSLLVFAAAREGLMDLIQKAYDEDFTSPIPSTPPSHKSSGDGN